MNKEMNEEIRKIKSEFCGNCGKYIESTPLKECKVLSELHSDHYHTCKKCCIECFIEDHTEGSCIDPIWKNSLVLAKLALKKIRTESPSSSGE